MKKWIKKADYFVKQGQIRVINEDFCVIIVLGSHESFASFEEQIKWTQEDSQSKRTKET
jgi:hypothetical protein